MKIALALPPVALNFRRAAGLAAVLALPLAVVAIARAQEKKDEAYVAPTFPKEIPFDPKEWLTNDKFPAIGDPRAKRVSKDPFVVRWQTFPPTLRTDGPNSNLLEMRTIHELMYETLVTLHPETEEFMPQLASHWKREMDEASGTQTFWFRINPKARWRDGGEVTAEDVKQSFWHVTQDDREDPSNVLTFKEAFEDPEVLDKYTVRVKTKGTDKAKGLNWRLFMYFGGSIKIFPAKEIHIPGKKYLDDYNWNFITGSGPYFMKPEDLKKGESVQLTRRTDWWAENEPWAKNTYNFDKIKTVVVREDELEFQMFKKGDLDHFRPTMAKKWKTEYPKEEIVQKGWVKRRKVFTQCPKGTMGFEFNMREKPFDDKNVRLALAHLFNRELLMEKLMFNEYDSLNSYFPGGSWGADDENELIGYDPDAASALLAKAGFKARDKNGILVGPDGKPFEITLEFSSPSFEPHLLIVKKDFEKAGVKLELKAIDASTLQKKVSERQFQMHLQSWGGLLFPNPETSWSSKLADQKNNNNHVGFKNARVDELCAKYNITFDRAEQKKIIREIDKLIYNEFPVALAWYAQYHRMLYWDKFGHPDNYFTRTNQDPQADMMLLWWFDPDRMKALDEARAEGKTLEQGTVDVKPWDKK